MTRIIGLDCGHGLHTAGKQTPTGIKEWTLNDKVGDKITEMLKDYDCIVIRTDHNEGEIDESLAARVSEYIKKGAEALVSIHHNAYTGKWNGATGVEIYTDRTPIAGDNALAKAIYPKLVTYTGLPGRGIKRANFTVIDQDRVPAILIEGGFMDGTADYKVITSDAGQSAYAKAVTEGLIEFLNLKKKNTVVAVALYQTHDKVKNKWLPNVRSDSKKDYAGNYKNAVDGVLVNLTRGNIWSRVHVKASKGKRARWLNEVKNREDFAGNLGEEIDAVMFKIDTGKKISYAVREKDSGRWLPPVTGYNVNDKKNGYAGNLGKTIDAIRITIE